MFIRKVHTIKKLYWSDGVIDLWYVEWQKQEKHIELLPIPQSVNKILDSTFKLGEMKLTCIMLRYGLFT